MIKSTAELRAELSRFGNPDTKIERMRKNGELFFVKRGFYSTEGSLCKESLCSLVHGPSYVSFEDALSFYGLIPEKVAACTCATYGKQRSKRCRNDFGYYIFRNVPKEAYPYGVVAYKQDGQTWAMAAPEKAVCDTLYYKSPVEYGAFEGLLFDGMRFDEEGFAELDGEALLRYALKYRHRNLRNLERFVKEALQ